MRLRLTAEADADIVRALRQTRKLFGTRQVAVYADIIDRGVAMVAENPSRPSSMQRSDIREGVKSFHLELVTRRRHSASHLLYFKEMKASDGVSEVVVIGVLHERMEPKRRLSRVLRGMDFGENDDAAPDTRPK